MFDFARMIAPAARIFRTIAASRVGIQPFNASDPAVVCKSFVSKLSFTIIGMQCSCPVSPSVRYRLSSESAIARAFGLIVTIALIAGPFLSYAAMRSRYMCTSDLQVSVFALSAACTCAIVVSSRRNGGVAARCAWSGELQSRAPIAAQFLALLTARDCFISAPVDWEYSDQPGDL